MTYKVVRTIKGRQYHYEQESYREGGRVRTRSKYLGPADGGVRKKRRLLGLLLDELQDALRRPPDWESPEDRARNEAVRELERSKQDRINELLTGSTITLEGMAEVVALQSELREGVTLPDAVAEPVSEAPVAEPTADPAPTTTDAASEKETPSTSEGSEGTGAGGPQV